MRCDSFARSALFAAGAAVGWSVWTIIASPIVGPRNALALYLTGATALYIAALSPRRWRRLSVAVVAVVLAAALALCARTTTELAIALAAILGIARSAFRYRAAPARAAALEVTLLVGGLLFARFLAGSTLSSTGLALWGFLLVQSLFFLVAGRHPRSPTAPRADPFDDAHRRAVALLERTVV